MAKVRRISFCVPGRPQPKGSFKPFMPRGARFPIVTNDNPRTKPWQQAVTFVAMRYRPKEGLWSGPVVMTVSFWMPKPKSLPKRKPSWHIKKPDLDKLIRTIKDALSGIIYVDDAQVVLTVLEKNYGDWPGIEVVMEDLTGTKPKTQERGI